MNIPEIHTNLLWDLTALLVLLTLVYLIFLFLLRNGPLLSRNDKKEKKKQIREIISKLLLHGPAKLNDNKMDRTDLKVELWKLLQQAGTKRIMRNVLLEMNKEMDGRARRSIYKITKEFGLQIDAFENLGHLGNPANNKDTAQILANDDKDNSKDIETIMDEPKMNRPSDSDSKNVCGNPELSKGEVLDIDFIPMVTKNEDTIDGNSSEIHEVLMMNNDLEFLDECLGSEGFERNPYEAIFKEIYDDKDILSPRKPQRKEPSFLNIDFLPIILEIEDKILKPDTNINPNDLEVNYEVIIDPHIKKQISDILNSHMEEQNRVEDIADDDSYLDLGAMVLPAAKFYTDWEFKKVKLLHSIAEMGDIREVPLLNEMLDEEENESIANLINEIIFKFLSEYPMDIDEEDYDGKIVDFGEHYVYNHLFNSLDRESQLLFLQEIQHIGDLSDLYFLQTLHHHTDKVIAEKAKLVSLHMETKLPSLPSDIVEDLSDRNLNVKKAVNITQKMHVDPSISFGISKSGYAPSDPPSMETLKNDKEKTLDHSSVPADLEAGNFFSNDLFDIAFDITTSEPITFCHSAAYKKKDNLETLGISNFLDHLKDLTYKIFKK